MSFLDKIQSKISRFFSGTPQATSDLEESESNSHWLRDGYSWIPDWKSILGSDWDEWQNLVNTPRNGDKVLIATSMGGNSVLTPLETLLAVALTTRGADVHFLLCDKALPACQNCYASDQNAQQEFLKNGPKICDWCFDVGNKSIRQLGLPLHLFSDFANEQKRAEIFETAKGASISEIENYVYLGINLSESVKSASLRFFGKCDIYDENLQLPVLRRYLAGAMISTFVLNELFEQYKFKHVLSNQGFYVPQSNVVSVAKKFDSHVITWDLAYRKSCLHFSHDDAIIKKSGDEPNEIWENIRWNDSVKSEIENYLAARWSGTCDWQHNITDGIDSEPLRIANEIGLDPNKPTIGLLTNVIWDAQISYPANAFSDQIEWLINSVEYFKNRPDLQLLIRVHPAELKSWIASRQFAIDEIKKAFAEIPKNVFVIPPESKLNTYQAMKNCNAVIVYGTVAGLELACMGIPVIVAGQAWVRNKGISIDVSNPNEYKTILDQLPFDSKLSQDKIDRALKYAYHFYMRTVLPISIVDPMPYENAPYKIRQQPLKMFAKGGDEGLDIACDGILKNAPFIYAAEEHVL